MCACFILALLLNQDKRKEPHVLIHEHVRRWGIEGLWACDEGGGYAIIHAAASPEQLGVKCFLLRATTAVAGGRQGQRNLWE